MTGGWPSCGCKSCKSSGPNGGRAATAGEGRLSRRLGGWTAAAVLSADEASDRCWLSLTSGPSRWPQAGCTSRANVRTKKIPERHNILLNLRPKAVSPVCSRLPATVRYLKEE